MNLILIILLTISSIFTEPNENEIFIKHSLLEMDKYLSKYDFEDGELYFDNHTDQVQLLKFGKRHKTNTFLYCISKDDNDSIIVYSSKDIIGYRIEQEYYVKRTYQGHSFFMHQLERGKLICIKRVNYLLTVLFYTISQRMNTAGLGLIQKKPT
ncbi:MAG: hypothetical protein OCD76_04150 [Reichenbachiella sp.]